jgi:hypothetical protein
VLGSEEDGIVFQCWCAMALYTTVPSFWFWMHNDVIDSTSWRDLVFRRTPQLCDLAGSCIEALLGSIEACWSSDWSAGQWTRFSWPRTAELRRGSDDGKAWNTSGGALLLLYTATVYCRRQRYA